MSNAGDNRGGGPAGDRPVVIGVLHPGRMGAAVAGQAVAGGAEVLWCPDGRSPATAARASAAGLRPKGDLANLLPACQIILSICPPEYAESVAERVLAGGFRGLYLEANAVSAERLARIAGSFADTDARLLDGAIFGPPFRDDTVARLYLAGAAHDMAAVAALFDGTRVDVVALRTAVGSASALKMAHSSYQKIARPLAAVAHALANRHGVGDHLLTEAERITASPLAELDRLPGVAARAWRWTPEMREVADSLRAAELPADFAVAAATVLHRWEGDRDDWDIPIELVLQHLRRGDERPRSASAG